MQIDIPHIVQAISKEIQAISKELGPQRFGFTLMCPKGVPRTMTKLAEPMDTHVHRGRVFGGSSKNDASWTRVRDMQNKIVLDILPRVTPYQMYVTVDRTAAVLRMKLGDLSGVKCALSFPEFATHSRLLDFIDAGIKRVDELGGLH